MTHPPSFEVALVGTIISFSNITTAERKCSVATSTRSVTTTVAPFCRTAYRRKSKSAPRACFCPVNHDRIILPRIDQDESYVEIAKKRIEYWKRYQAPYVTNPELARQVKSGQIIPVAPPRPKPIDKNQLGLF